MDSFKDIAKGAVSQYSQNFSLYLAIALLLFFFLFSRHDPFIVRSAKLAHRSMVSHLDVHDQC